MKVWIDASPAAAELQVFGMSPVERHVRAARRLGIAGSDIVVDGGRRSLQATRGLLGTLPQTYPVQVVCGEGSFTERLQRALADAPDGLLALAGDCVADQRLIRLLSSEPGTVVVDDRNSVERALPRPFSRVYGDWDERGDGSARVVRLEPGTVIPEAGDISELGAILLEQPSARQFDAAGRNQHLAMQRRDVPFWIRSLSDAKTRDSVERFLFDASYKGSTDLLTRYVLPYAVWPLVLLCTRWRIQPNPITYVSLVATLAAVPFFAYGWWVIGLILAWSMAVLDSVDGKVARLTLTDSRIGELLDHGLDIIHPPIWYFGWAIGLSGLQPIAALLDGQMLRVPVFQAAALMLGLYIVDRLVLAIYKHRYRRGLHSHGRLDALVRNIISRRNINLALFTVALMLGWGVAAFYLVVAWQLATLLWHALRTAWIIGRREMPATT